MSGEPFYITTAIAYPNGKPHIGHAYEAIAADAIARFRRLQGRDVRFVTGTDEHGLKMVQTARAAGRETLDFADEMSGYFQSMCAKLNISVDAFVRTTEERHTAASVAIWNGMKAKDDLYLDRYEGWYSVRDEAFYEEKELIEGEGGQKLSPQGTPVEWTVEESWFFPPFALSGAAAQAVCRESGLHQARQPPQRSDPLCRRRSERPLGLAHQF